MLCCYCCVLSQIIQLPTKTVTGCSTETKHQQRKTQSTCLTDKGMIIASMHGASVPYLENQKSAVLKVTIQPLIIEVMRLIIPNCNMWFLVPFCHSVSHHMEGMPDESLGCMNVTAVCYENKTPSGLEPKCNVLAASDTKHGQRTIGVVGKKKQAAILEQPTSSSSTAPRNGLELCSPHFSSTMEDALGVKLGWTSPPPGGQEKQTSSSIMEPKDNIHFVNHHSEPYHPSVSTTEVPSIGLAGCGLRYRCPTRYSHPFTNLIYSWRQLL